MSIFEKASKQKVRFNLKAGTATVEDLWDLPLTSEKRDSLDSTAKSINAELKASQEESFVTTASKGSVLLQLKLDLVKYVIAAKIAEREVAKTQASNKAKLDKLVELKAVKQNEALGALTEAEIDAQIAALQS